MLDQNRLWANVYKTCWKDLRDQIYFSGSALVAIVVGRCPGREFEIPSVSWHCGECEDVVLLEGYVIKLTLLNNPF